MSAETCPPLEHVYEQYLAGRGPLLEHARACEGCSAILEEHRQLEQGLFRLADPLPPPDFLRQVMARVEQAPAPIWAEVRAGMTILVATLLLGAGLFLLRGGSLAGLGASLAHAYVSFHDLALALGKGLFVTWSVAAVPIAAGVTLLLFVSLLGLRRLTASHYADAEVSS